MNLDLVLQVLSTYTFRMSLFIYKCDLKAKVYEPELVPQEIKDRIAFMVESLPEAIMINAHDYMKGLHAINDYVNKQFEHRKKDIIPMVIRVTNIHFMAQSVELINTFTYTMECNELSSIREAFIAALNDMGYDICLKVPINIPSVKCADDLNEIIRDISDHMKEFTSWYNKDSDWMNVVGNLYSSFDFKTKMLALDISFNKKKRRYKGYADWCMNHPAYSPPYEECMG